MPSLTSPQLLSGAGSLIGLVITASLIVLIADWRLALFALVFQYVFLGLLLTTFIPGPLATVRIISGALAVSILYVTMRHRAGNGERASSSPVDATSVAGAAGGTAPANDVFVVGVMFRLFTVALVAVSLIGLVSSMTFLSLPSYLLFGSVWLMAVGLVGAMLSRDVLRLGLGILVFTGGFCVLDMAVEGSLFLYGLANISDLLIAVVVAHLGVMRREAGERRRRGDAP